MQAASRPALGYYLIAKEPVLASQADFEAPWASNSPPQQEAMSPMTTGEQKPISTLKSVVSILSSRRYILPLLLCLLESEV